MDKLTKEELEAEIEKLKKKAVKNAIEGFFAGMNFSVVLILVIYSLLY